MTTSHLPETSIVIRAKNEERWLPAVLDAIARQTYRDFEVILVDSGSTDRTCEIAAAYGATLVSIKPEEFTFGYALNVGIREARGHYVAMLSAHAIPLDDRWLDRLVTPLRNVGTAMVFGGQRGHPVSKFSEARDFERVFPNRPQTLDDEHYFVNNANSAIRRDLWVRHPFDEHMPGLEDIEWAKHWLEGHGLAVRYEPEAAIAHVHTESWAQVHRRFRREGVAGRWVEVRIIRHIPSEVLREAAWCVADLWHAARAGRLFGLFGEIVRYRYHKAAGIVQGIVESRLRDWWYTIRGKTDATAG